MESEKQTDPTNPLSLLWAAVWKCSHLSEMALEEHLQSLHGLF